jgi:hypothetical protein
VEIDVGLQASLPFPARTFAVICLMNAICMVQALFFYFILIPLKNKHGFILF